MKKKKTKNSPGTLLSFLSLSPSLSSLLLLFSLFFQPDGKETSIDYGACVWSTGVAIHPLVKQLQGKLAEGSQTHFRSVVTTPWLEVKGMGEMFFFSRFSLVCFAALFLRSRRCFLFSSIAKKTEK